MTATMSPARNAETLNETAAQTTSQVNPNTAVWFELPVRDLGRSTRFYEQVFEVRLATDARFPGLAVFPKRQPSGTTGALAEIHDADSSHQASTDGTIVYLSCDGQLDAVLKRAQAAGAKLLEEVAQLPAGMGYTAQFRDLDGNRVGLHAAF